MILKIMDSLDLKYAFSVLRYIYSHGPVKKKDLASIIKSHQVLDNLLEALQKDGYIQISSNKIGPRVYSISLSEKGKDAAQKLKEAQDVAERKNEIQVHENDEKINLELSTEEAEKAKHLRLLYHINVLDDHVTVEELTPGKPPRVFNIYIKKNGGGNFRLWCEEDNSYECWHVKAAWTYPQVQEMMMHYRGKTKICPVCGYENPEQALYCMHCGAKLGD